MALLKKIESVKSLLKDGASMPNHDPEKHEAGRPRSRTSYLPFHSLSVEERNRYCALVSYILEKNTAPQTGILEYLANVYALPLRRIEDDDRDLDLGFIEDRVMLSRDFVMSLEKFQQGQHTG